MRQCKSNEKQFIQFTLCQQGKRCNHFQLNQCDFNELQKQHIKRIAEIGDLSEICFRPSIRIASLHFGVNLHEGWSLVDFSVEEICGVGGKKFITQCVMCITHCDMYKTHCIMYKTHCVMKNFVGSGGFPTGVLP